MLNTVNTFSGGLDMDNSELVVGNDKLVNALNATLTSFDGHENILQNDMGNVKIVTEQYPDGAYLPAGSIPIGVTVYEDIIYIALIKNLSGTFVGEIGSFPSPNYADTTDTNLVWLYLPLQVGYTSDADTCDLTTEYFNWDIEHPLEILTERSYDNSVNLIITDNKNAPILINTGFSTKLDETCEIIKRIGKNNTNRYSLDSESLFKLLTSLNKRTNNISKFTFNGLSHGGLLKVGNYVFYAVACDRDGNETDFICESGIIPVFLGLNGDPYSAHGGMYNEQSDKSIDITIENIDEAYKYIKLYYSVVTSLNLQTPVKTFYAVNNMFNVLDSKCNILFTGFESIEESAITNLVTNYFNASLVKSLAICLDLLFLGNITQSEGYLDYEALKQLSYTVYPTAELKNDLFEHLDECTYGDSGYSDALNVYNYTGYHNGEIYRFGIVYIREDSSTTDVFDIIGVNNTNYMGTIPDSETIYNRDVNNYTYVNEDSYINSGFNTKGVTRIFEPSLGINDIIYVLMHIPSNFATSLLNLGLKGYFFVRLKRIPTLLGLSYITNVCEDSFVPTMNIECDYLRDTTTVASKVPTHLVESHVSVDIESYYERYRHSKFYVKESKENGSYLGTTNTVLFEHFEKSLQRLGADYELRLIPLSKLVGVRSNKNTVSINSEDITNESQREDILKAITNFDVSGVTNDDENLNYSAVTTNKQYYYYYKYSNSDIYFWSSVSNLSNITITEADGSSTTVNVVLTYKLVIYKELTDNDDVTKPIYYYTVYDSNETLLSKEDCTLEYTYSINGDYSSNDGKYCGYKDLLELLPIELNAYAGYCPDFLLNLPYYNNLFTGAEFKIQPITSLNYLDRNLRQFKYKTKTLDYMLNIVQSKILAIDDSLSLVSMQTDNTKDDANNNNMLYRPIVYFSSKVGEAGTSTFKYAGPKYVQAYLGRSINSKNNKEWSHNNDAYAPCNIVRGLYSPYIGIWCELDIANTLVNIYIPGYSTSNMENYFKLRFLSNSAYYSISDRISIDSINNVDCYRGDCFKGIFTERVNRNFLDPTYPTNDTVINTYSWSSAIMAYDVNSYGDPNISLDRINHTCLRNMEDYRIFSPTTEAFTKLFNLGDLNAVLLGTWISFPVASSYNIMLRANDESYVTENLTMGIQGRVSYPSSPMYTDGNHKVPESTAYNQGYTSSSGFKEYANTEISTALTNYLNTYYKNRIYYSNVHSSAYLTNGSRIFLNEHCQDFGELYGVITKLVEFRNYLIVILEHGILALPINPLALIQESEAGNVVITTNKVFPEKPEIISGILGSTYPESIVVTDSYIYGVDVYNKKIWRTGVNSLEVISDFKIQQFLNDGIHIKNSIKVGKHNIKSHYNTNKGDVMFTFYDYDNDLLWNICYNEHTGTWMTLYSWIPSYSANIGNNWITLNIEDANSFVNLGGNNESSYLWKHGLATKVPSLETIKTTNWYGQQHPFEFEFIVNPDSGSTHKIWDCLDIISNKAAPESFHYEIIGQCYDFKDDKPNEYIRQEIIRKLYNECGNIPYLSYDSHYVGVTPHLKKKSVIFPLYYRHIDNINKIYDSYVDITNPPSGHNYAELTGTEVIHYPRLLEFRLRNNAKGVDIDTYGRLRGNMRYVEDQWRVQINPMSIIECNEKTWGIDSNGRSKVPIVLNQINTTDLTPTTITSDSLSNLFTDYTTSDIKRVGTLTRKEIKMKDRFIRIKIRYSGEDLATILAIRTLYTLSYA